MQMLLIFNEFAWLVHVGILDGVENNLTFRIYLFLRQLKKNE